MRRFWMFISGLVVALALFLITISWYVFAYQSGNSTMSTIMGQMMGGQYSGVVNPMPSYVWLTIIVLIAALVASVVGTLYYVAYPEIKQTTEPTEIGKSLSNSEAVDNLPPTSPPSSPTAPSKESWSMLMRTSKPEEKKILEVLSAHNGVYLQKFIVKESGLSKLKTHRIISRFAERGIVIATKSGNTNEVRLSPWLNQPSQPDKLSKKD
jgi:uncharacterized membrane protein